MKETTLFTADLTDLLDRLNDSNLVIEEHDRNYNRVIPNGAVSQGKSGESAS